MSTNENTPLLENPANSIQEITAQPSLLTEHPEPWWGPRAASSHTLLPYLHGLRRHWASATALGVVCGLVLAAAVWFGWGPRYASSAFLRVATTDKQLVFQAADYQRFTQQAYDIYKDTQLQLMKNSFVLTAALRQPNVANLPSVKREQDPVAWLQDELRVAFPGDAEIMQVSLVGNNATEAATLVNAVVDAYLKEVVEKEQSERRLRLSELDRVYTEKETEVRNKRTDLRALAERLGTGEADALALKQKIAIQELSDYQRQLSETTFALNHAQGELQVQQALMANVDNMEISQIELDAYANADPVVRELARQLADQRMVVDYTKSAAKSGTKLPYVTRHEDDLLRVQAQLDERGSGLREGIIAKKRAEIQQELQRKQIEVAIFQAQEASLKVDVAKKRDETVKLGVSSIDLEMMRTEVDELGRVLSDITKERESLKVEVRSASRITMLQAAEPPVISVNLVARTVLSVLAMVVGLCIPGGVILWWDNRAQRINSTEDVSQELGLTVLGAMPMIPSRIIRQLGSPSQRNQKWHLRVIESVDGIMARLLRKAETEQTRVVLITSPSGGEGKTTLATQLALSLTRNGHRTVLVDFDLRNPALDQAFGLSLQPGISEVLRGETSLSDVIQETGTDNLLLVTAGQWDRPALAALANGAAGPIFESLRTEAEFVVIDSGAVLPVADTRFVSQHVDTVVLSIFRDISRAQKVRAACEILEAFGVRSLEAVVTCPAENPRERNVKYV